MIRKQEFTRLRIEVEQAVNEVFEFAKNHEKNQNDYILFLSRSKYEPKYENNDRVTPWLLDHALDEILDRDRVDFLLEHLNSQYNFRAINTSDSKFSLTMELMIYTHLWESKRNLAMFKKLADLCDSKPYDFNVKVPSRGKYDFVVNNIRNVFEKHQLKIYDIIKYAYRSQLRNAFAHSVYHFGLNETDIVLENYDPPNSPIERLPFDEWTKIFLKSALLQNFIFNKFNQEIEDLEPLKEYEVRMDYGDSKSVGTIKYDSEGKRFTGKRN
ncbi:hypothetical protein [Psychroflexus sp. ALD_RP9]|uniref:hypothetical protein n=1 Tax=Psychroflexus sp. ALD_RP9 TaxID=2777186 RepID=UPI001A8FCA7D|nr:hypothetical protein [Psychroflexus sp. ALD_RP9]QSS96682.1 hypothetical protein IMZ30_09535 [Psychroflexus sp. ALD_RP9]